MQESRAAKRLKTIVSGNVGGVTLFAYPKDFELLGIAPSELSPGNISETKGAYLCFNSPDFTHEISFSAVSTQDLLKGLKILTGLDAVTSGPLKEHYISVSLDPDVFESIVTKTGDGVQKQL